MDGLKYHKESQAIDRRHKFSTLAAKVSREMEMINLPLAELEQDFLWIWQVQQSPSPHFLISLYFLKHFSVSKRICNINEYSNCLLYTFKELNNFFHDKFLTLARLGFWGGLLGLRGEGGKCPRSIYY